MSERTAKVPSTPPSPPVPLFTVFNHHSSQCGKAPAVDGDEPGAYHGYFENRYGEQSILVYRRDSARGTLWCGDADWRPYPVVEGRVEGLILSPDEDLWLQAAWMAAKGSR